MENKVAVILGTQWGDEGKGKMVDLLAEGMDLVCRCQGGSNAGHTVVVDKTPYFFHLIPSGVINPSCSAVVGNGVVVHIPTLLKEIEANKKKGIIDIEQRLFLSDRAHIVFDFHQTIDGCLEEMRGKSSLGTTRRGIGPAYSSKVLRNGIRMCDLVGDFDKFAEKLTLLVEYEQKVFPDLCIDIKAELLRYKEYAAILKTMVCDTVSFLHDAIQSGKKVLGEGANATMLDIDLGTYPYVTSSNCTIGGVCTGTGIPPQRIGTVYGVVKAYTTRVGDGVFPTELKDEIGRLIQEKGHEFGTTTGRPRRCGWLDVVVVRYTNMVNGYTSLALTKLDVLDSLHELKIAVGYRTSEGKLYTTFPADVTSLDDIRVEYITVPGWKTDITGIREFSHLPTNAQNYVRKVEELVGVPVQWVGVGKERSAVIQLF